MSKEDIRQSNEVKSGFEIDPQGKSTFFIPDRVTRVWGFRPDRLTITDLDSVWGVRIDIGPSGIKTSQGIDKTDQQTLLPTGSEKRFSPIKRAFVRLQDGNPPIISPETQGNPKVKYFFIENTEVVARQTRIGTEIEMTGHVEEITTTNYLLWDMIQESLMNQARQRARHYTVLYQK